MSPARLREAGSAHFRAGLTEARLGGANLAQVY
jgi:hypothetical protein